MKVIRMAHVGRQEYPLEVEAEKVSILGQELEGVRYPLWEKAIFGLACRLLNEGERSPEFFNAMANWSALTNSELEEELGVEPGVAERWRRKEMPDDAWEEVKAFFLEFFGRTA